MTRRDAARHEAEAALRAEAHAAQREAAEREAGQRDLARREAAQLDAERHEAAKREEASRAAAREEAARREAAEREAAQRVAAQLAAAQSEAARREAAAREQAEREADDHREAARRALGQQLDEEASRREAAAAANGSSSMLPQVLSSSRRGRLFGRADADPDLVFYAEAFARKIQLNRTIELVRDAAKRPHFAPLVTVALRHDGSVESVTVVTSSGVPAIDAAIGRIVQSQAPYAAFPPALAHKFDVIEIRRTWPFDVAVRLD